MPKLDKQFQKVLESRYNLLDIIETKEFDLDPGNLLVSRLKKTIKSEYQSDDRYVIVLFDTCYYFQEENLTLHNLISIWKHLDIPFYTMIFYTNHFGIRQEFERHFSKLHHKDRPTIIETFYNPGNYNDDCDKTLADPCIEEIQYPLLCMMKGAPRTHRQVLYSSLKDVDPGKVVMTINSVKCPISKD